MTDLYETRDLPAEACAAEEKPADTIEQITARMLGKQAARIAELEQALAETVNFVLDLRCDDSGDWGDVMFAIDEWTEKHGTVGGERVVWLAGDGYKTRAELERELEAAKYDLHLIGETLNLCETCRAMNEEGLEWCQTCIHGGWTDCDLSKIELKYQHRGPVAGENIDVVPK